MLKIVITNELFIYLFDITYCCHRVRYLEFSMQISITLSGEHLTWWAQDEKYIIVYQYQVNSTDNFMQLFQELRQKTVSIFFVVANMANAQSLQQTLCTKKVYCVFV